MSAPTVHSAWQAAKPVSGQLHDAAQTLATMAQAGAYDALDPCDRNGLVDLSMMLASWSDRVETMEADLQWLARRAPKPPGFWRRLRRALGGV